MKKPKKLPFDLPRSIILIPGTQTYYNSTNGDKIHISKLQKYVTGKDPIEVEKAKEVELKHELIISRRWDLNTEK